MFEKYSNMYKISENLQFKPQEKSINYKNPDMERKEKNEKIINKYNKLYQPSNDLQRRI